MKLKELNIIGGSVYLNIVHKNETETLTMPAKAAVAKYGELEVTEHFPYEPTQQPADEDVADTKPNGKDRKTIADGMDIVILKG